MTILAILQNQWFKPESVQAIERIYRQHGGTPEDRAELNARFLFYRSLTGKRLRAAFGSELCERIVWEEASAKIGIEPSAKFAADPAHILSLISHFKPVVVLAFGAVADRGVWQAMQAITAQPDRTIEFQVIGGPHPAARQPTVFTELQAMAEKLRKAVTACA